MYRLGEGAHVVGLRAVPGAFPPSVQKLFCIVEEKHPDKSGCFYFIVSIVPGVRGGEGFVGSNLYIFLAI